MEISNLVYKYVVILSTGSHHYLTEVKNTQLKQANLDDLIELENGNSFKVSASMEILTVADYKSQFPEKQPTSYGQPTSNKTYTDYRSENLSKTGLASMVSGIQRAITEFEADGYTPIKAKELLTNAIKTYKLRYK